MRREKIITIESEGRDLGKRYFITEMPSYKAEKWAARALNALMASGIELPANLAGSGLLGVASLGLAAFSGLPWEQVEPLLDEMFQCVQVMPDPLRPQVRRALMEEADDIEEVGTRLTLRREVLELHLGFSFAEKLSKLKAEKAPKGSSTTPTSQG